MKVFYLPRDWPFLSVMCMSDCTWILAPHITLPYSDSIASLSELVDDKSCLCRYTISAAQACFLDNDLGSLAPGKLADFVILSTDSWDHLAAGGSASVVATYVGGVRSFPWESKL